MDHRPHSEERPWGTFIQFTNNEPSTVKIIIVQPGEELSLQYHNHRSEFWYVLSGNGTFVTDDTELAAQPGTYHIVPTHAKHRIKGGSEELRVLEIAFGDFDEDDIVRLQDKYDRS